MKGERERGGGVGGGERVGGAMTLSITIFGIQGLFYTIV